MSIELATTSVTTEFRYQRKDYEYLVTLGVVPGEMCDPEKTQTTAVGSETTASVFSMRCCSFLARVVSIESSRTELYDLAHIKSRCT